MSRTRVAVEMTSSGEGKPTTMNTGYPPGPHCGILGIGNLRRMRDNLLAYCIEMTDRFGDCVHYQIGATHLFHFSHPEHLRDVLVNQNDSFQRPSRCRSAFRGWYGEGILLNDGPHWNAHRQTVQRHLEKGGVARHREIIDELTSDYLRTWSSTEVDMGEGLARLTFQILAKSLWGVDVGDMAAEFVRLIGTLQYSSMQTLFAPISLPFWMPGTRRRRLHRVMRSLDVLVAEIIDRHRRDGGHGILAELFPDGESRDRHSVTALNLLLGSESTATAMTWATHLLATHPIAQSLARCEHGAARDHSAPGTPVGGTQSYTEAVFKEAIRLYPPAYVLIREAIRPVKVGGFVLPTGSQIVLPIYVTHRDQRWFEAPTEFLPERFLNRDSAPSPFSYLPFGVGPRHCVGRQLAFATATGVSSAILKRGVLSPSDGVKEPEFESLISLRPRTPIRIRLHPL